MERQHSADVEGRTLDAKLDEALVETFPASDPIAVGNATGTEFPGRPADRKAPIIDAEDVAQAHKAPQTRRARASGRQRARA